MNNYERIKSMTVDEMAELFNSSKPKCCGFCMGYYMGCLRMIDCKNAIKDWLMSDRPPVFLNNKNFKTKDRLLSEVEDE